MKYSILIPLIGFVAASCGHAKEEIKVTQKKPTPAYKLATVTRGGVASVIKLPAQLAAFQEVSVFPKLNAYVKNVLVDVGSRVGQGQTLMTLEAPELFQAVLQAKEKYARARADYSIMKEQYLRLAEASKTPGAISPMDLSAARAKMDADSSIANAERANWQMQQTMTNYLRVTAPFRGVITERNVHPGALVSTAVKDKPMLELKQIDHLRLLVDIPENLAATIANRDTVSFYVSALQGRKMTGFISRRTQNVNAQFRSERMEIDVPNGDGILAPGMYADITLYSRGNINAMWVPRSAVVTSTERKYVWLVQNGKRSRVDVSTGNQTADKIEIFGNLQPGDTVIAQATDDLTENS